MHLAQNASDAVFIIVIVVALLLFSWVSSEMVCFFRNTIPSRGLKSWGQVHHPTSLRTGVTQCFK